MVFLLFVLWKAINITISLFAFRFIPYLGFFSYPKDLLKFHLPKFIYSFANFDGVYYLRIAQKGYEQYEQVFFPLYPLLIRIFSPVFSGNYLLSGLFISNLAFLIGLLVFKKYLQLTPLRPSGYEGQAINNWQLIIIYLLLFPTSFFFGAVYTEGLFFLEVVLVLYFLNRKQLFLAGLAGFFAGLTRVNGVLLVIPFLIEFIRGYKKNKNVWKLAMITIAPILGLLIYMRYLLITTGDQLYFFHSQTIFGAARSTKLILLPQVYFRYLKIFFTSQLNFQFFISLSEFLFFNIVFIVLILDLIKNLKPARPAGGLKIKNYSLIGLSLFSFANLLLPTLTGSFMSIPRFALLSLSFFVFLGKIKNVWIVRGLAILFLIFHVVALGFFIQGYFVS